MKLVDSSSWIEFLRGHSSAPALRVKELVRSGRAAWCDLIAVELWNGVRIGGERKALMELDNEIASFAIDDQVWQKARKLALRSRESGLTAPANDIVIAACAQHHGLELEHCDHHFEKILPLAAKL